VDYNPMPAGRQGFVEPVIVHLLVKLGYIKGNNRTCERR
jgi:hypothetical protein